ncbi:thiol-disulfide oxidoreductase ResA [Salisediminibacterium selenitireducens]|uniref:Alkyl hydroperoxide reductase/ Thiol specific antioxidant/ Mal allergen n=1 Tax=Bacillus selenitireducens (strain ATCC 700615 / DSM 15326 / MLS10) TaxID=439292 RepID=D6XVE4_BACIE|nr:thiol-disulfide oxidoreductase ResA [Salisediminibacterium selenitireducens]ADH99682.1 alkyl hydroperoxide reductase/ Thiol specific antioxidant/ Mal allergen [[Bacillus] selenitireducens MLS10]
MKNKRFLMRLSILIVMIGAVGYSLYVNFSEERGVVDAGDTAPNFIVQDLDGENVELTDYNGQGIYLNFWATYCVYCREKMQYLQEHEEEYREKGVTILNVNVDETTLQVERHKERQNLTFPLYIDRNMLVSNAYGVASLPTVFLIDHEGTVKERQIGGKTEGQVVEALESLVP